VESRRRRAGARRVQARSRRVRCSVMN
jgi:hypothetical protein